MLRLQTRDRAAAKAAALDARIDAFDRDAQRLCAQFPDIVRAASGDHAVQLKLLKAEADKQREAVRRSAELFQSMEEQQAVQAELETALSRVKERRDKWFEAAGAASEAQWLEALAASERLQAIEAEMYRLDALLTAGLASGQYGQLEVWYQEADEYRLVEMKLEAESELLETERRLQELHEQNGRLRQKLDQLLRENERQRLAMQLQQQQSDLEAMIGRYAVASIGLTLISRTKRIMEEQRQPAVLREASRFMAIMSEGKYKRIVLPEGARSIRLITGEDREVDSIFLSRGTAEQLYLSMRFALADEASAGLPMILDDLFVNFDRSRLEAAADVLRELAERRQIVLLTCHEHVRSLLLDKLPAAQSVAFT
jgi:uncharacterized protein YhaN